MLQKPSILAGERFSVAPLTKAIDRARPFEPGAYPRAYRPSRVALTLLSLLALGFAGLKTPVFYGCTGCDRSLAAVVPDLVSVTLLVLAVVTLRGLWRYQLTLGADFIEARENFSTVRLDRSQIEGYQASGRNGLGIILRPHPASGAAPIRIGMTFKRDAPFYAWFKGIPSLDRLALAQNWQQVCQDERLGASVEARSNRIERARSNVAGLAIMTILLELAALVFAGHDSAALVAVLTPWIAVGVCAADRGAYTLIDAKRGELRGSLGVFVVLACIMSALALYRVDIHLINWQRGLVIVPIGAAIWTWLAYRLSPALPSDAGRNLLPACALMGVVCSVYWLGLGLWVDTRWDTSPVESQVVKIENRRCVRGTKGQVSCFIQLARPSLTRDATEVAVSLDLYRALSESATVRIERHQGTLGVAWYELLQSPARTRPSAHQQQPVHA